MLTKLPFFFTMFQKDQRHVTNSGHNWKKDKINYKIVYTGKLFIILSSGKNIQRILSISIDLSGDMLTLSLW